MKLSGEFSISASVFQTGSVDHPNYSVATGFALPGLKAGGA